MLGFLTLLGRKICEEAVSDEHPPPHGLNTEIIEYSKEMCNFYLFSNKLCHKFRYVLMIMKNTTDFELN